ncbi:MAG: hypothetical protein KAT76_07340, partial [Bacteroidales bacterium]|nr:hypothetical protein [Bacteroidales bacterium]
HIRNIIFIFIITALSLTACNNQDRDNVHNLLNTDHLKHLYTDVTLENGNEAGVINIYSEYPDYAYAVEPNEGFSCVDDVARALVFLSAYTKNCNDPEIEIMIDNMTGFILSMQAENGYFYNFLWGDMSINKTYKTSVAEPNWWSWRALWALGEIYPKLSGDLAQRTKFATEQIIETVKDKYLELPKDTIQYEGMTLPNWFPSGTAYDQSAILMVGMESYYNNIKKDTALIALIEKFAEGLLLTQKGDRDNFPYGAYLSWNNLWHSYGNTQAYAMLRAGKLLGRNDFIESALTEINYFYPYLINAGYLHHIYIIEKEGQICETGKSMYPQIAYGIRPIVYACLEAYDITKDKKYVDMAQQVASWLAGNNPAAQQMYDPETGRCFDGIGSEKEVNRNSGAESTIEALLILQAIKNHPVADINNIYE